MVPRGRRWAAVTELLFVPFARGALDAEACTGPRDSAHPGPGLPRNDMVSRSLAPGPAYARDAAIRARTGHTVARRKYVPAPYPCTRRMCTRRIAPALLRAAGASCATFFDLRVLVITGMLERVY